MSNINIQYYKTSIGELILGSYNDKLCLLDFQYRKMRNIVDNRLQKGFDAVFIEKNDGILKDIRIQIDEYLVGERKEFDMPIITVGTDFQKQVWNALRNIEYGKTVSYLELAKSINNEKAVRAVASANGANAIGLVIPCHRVIESGGGLGGYGGGLSVKKKLLKIEKINSNQTLL
ncbi:MAG: methylated-DNA--[protein]-cysteine S-methyltransferase [Candidatus Moraniibacteriota bacterium]|jgi:methylated-DNA-[protein]-cysteine S-methyltransferase